MSKYDAVLVVSFGGPEGKDDVMPFLENVLRGKNVPRERMLEVAEHYYHFDGVSPINQQNRELIDALKADLAANEKDIPIYWGNRNWHPMLEDTIAQMHKDGVKNVIAFMTSGFSCYSGCRQYREDIYRAIESLGLTGEMTVDKIRVFYNHPDFVGTVAERVNDAIAQLKAESADEIRIVFTAHSLPTAMADKSNYSKQLEEASRLVAEEVGIAKWDLVYQSRSGPPSQPWLDPDVCDFIQTLKDEGKTESVVISPIGFVSDHMEVLFDLDTEARELCDELGVDMVRAKSPGTHPRFVSMIRELIMERVEGIEKRAVGNFGPNHDVCPKDCCPSGRPPAGAGRPNAGRPDAGRPS